MLGIFLKKVGRNHQRNCCSNAQRYFRKNCRRNSDRIAQEIPEKNLKKIKISKGFPTTFQTRAPRIPSEKHYGRIHEEMLKELQEEFTKKLCFYLLQGILIKKIQKGF